MNDEKVFIAESGDTAGKACSIDYVCENCGHYPLEPVHGHFMCPECHLPTKCCEGAPAD
jgi:hypothetical protein